MAIGKIESWSWIDWLSISQIKEQTKFSASDSPLETQRKKEILENFLEKNSPWYIKSRNEVFKDENWKNTITKAFASSNLHFMSDWKPISNNNSIEWNLLKLKFNSFNS